MAIYDGGRDRLGWDGISSCDSCAGPRSSDPLLVHCAMPLPARAATTNALPVRLSRLWLAIRHQYTFVFTGLLEMAELGVWIVERD